MTLARVARTTFRRPHDFRFALREFYREVALERDPKLIETPPPPTGRTEYDAYLAAVAEAIAVAGGWPVPRWIDEPARVLQHPYFGNAPSGMRIPLLQESPVFFRKRNIFVDADEVEGALRKHEHAIRRSGS